MSWIGEMTDRAAGRLQGARDAVKGIEYEPRIAGEFRAPTVRESAAYGRWQEDRPPRNAYERDAFTSFPSELAADMDRVDRLAAEAEADREAWLAAEQADDLEASLRADQDREAGS